MAKAPSAKARHALGLPPWLATSPSAAYRLGRDRLAALKQAGLAGDAQRVGAERERRSLVQRPHEGLGFAGAITRHPARRQPRREGAAQRQRLHEVSRRPRLSLGGTSTRKRTEHRVDEAGDAGLAGAAGQRHGVVDRGEGGDALEEGDLVGRHAQEDEQPEVEIVQPTPGVRGEDPVEVALPAQRPVHELGGQGDVPRRQPSSRARSA